MIVRLQSPEGDWADCDVVVWERDEKGNWAALRLQSPEGDWADCDSMVHLLSPRSCGTRSLQSPEGDWADCDFQTDLGTARVVVSEAWGRCNPPKGIGLIAT